MSLATDHPICPDPPTVWTWVTPPAEHLVVSPERGTVPRFPGVHGRKSQSGVCCPTPISQGSAVDVQGGPSHSSLPRSGHQHETWSLPSIHQPPSMLRPWPGISQGRRTLIRPFPDPWASVPISNIGSGRGISLESFGADLRSERPVGSEAETLVRRNERWVRDD
jgi:hypothetical protein